MLLSLGGLSYLQVLLGRLRPGPRAEGDETDGLQREKQSRIAVSGPIWDVMPPSLEGLWV